MRRLCDPGGLLAGSGRSARCCLLRLAPRRHSTADDLLRRVPVQVVGELPSGFQEAVRAPGC